MPPNVAEQRRAGWALPEDAKEPITYLDQREGQWFESRVVPTFDQDDNLDSAYIFAQDVTDQKQAEKELHDSETRLGAMFDAQTADLRNSETRFRSTFERSAVGLAVATQDGELRLINQALCDFLGYSKDEMVGTPLRLFSHPDDLAETIDAFDRLFRQEFVIHDFEKRYVRKDGETVWGRVWLSTINDQNGKPLEALAVIQDITQRKDHEIALRESETQLRHAQSLAKLGTFDRNISDDTVTWSAEARRLYGVSDSEVISTERFVSLIHPDDRERVSETLKSMSPDNPTFEIELRVQRDDGSVRHTHTFGEMVFDEDGNATRLIGTNQDITERKLAEQKLRDTEARFRSVFENSAVGMTYTDLNGAIMVANQAYCILLGYSSDELMGRKVSDLTHPDDRVNPENLSREAAAGRFEIRDSEKRLLPKDGRALWARVNFSTVKDDGGRPIGTIGVIQDITRQKHDEMALQASETRLRHAQSIAQLGYFERDLQTDIITWSEESAEIFGQSESESILMKEFIEFVHPDDRDRVATTIFAAIERHDNFEIEFRVLRGDGTTRQVFEMAEVVRGADGHAVKVIGTTQDITERKQIEAQLAARQRAEALGQLTGGFAHEFNNLRLAITGNLELIEKGLLDQDDARAALSNSLEAAFHGSKLTGQLLSYVGIQSIVPKPIRAGELIERVSAMMRPALGETAVIEIEVTNSELWVTADEGLLEQVVINLIINARDAMASGGRIGIRTAVADTPPASGGSADHRSADGEHIEISVSDEGAGIPPENRDKVFDPFFTTKGVGEGTGLGLSMVDGFIRRQSGGDVTLESEMGRGTTVNIYLPRSTPIDDDPTVAMAPTEVSQTGTGTILVVEDEYLVLDALSTFLRQLGYTVLAAKNGTDAMEAYAESDGVDLLLCDVVLPGGMSGPELSGRLQKTRRISRPCS